MQILILNGPNLNLLGIRQTDIYGPISMDEYLGELRNRYPAHQFRYFQSNHEGVLIDRLHEYGFSCDGIILNAGGYSHTSVALADAVRSITVPVVEVHISDVKSRETFRQHSFLEDACIRSISGEGLEGYALAIQFLESLRS